MELSEYPSFGFGIGYGDGLMYCEVIMDQSSYDVYFNSRWMMTLTYTEDFSWIQAAGIILPQAIAVEIGLRIEHAYC